MATHAQGNGIAVSLAADAQGALWLARVLNGQVVVSRSSDGGKTFGNDNIVNNEPENVRAENQNRPKIAVHGKTVVVLWTQALETRFAGNVRFARSADGGLTFSVPQTINADHNDIGHGFSALAMNPDGKLAIAWIDARDSAAAKIAGRRFIGSSIYYTLSGDAGNTFSENQRLAANSCQCCRLGLAFAPDGVAVALWRHVFGKDTRDFATARLAVGSTVVRASEDNWHIDGCPHHGGDIAIDERGRQHLVWFTGSAEKPGLFYRRVDGKRLRRPLPFGNNAAQAGHPAVFAHGEQVHIAWREFSNDAYQLLSMHSDDGGQQWSIPRQLAASTGNTDLPLFVQGATHPLLFWNTQDAGLRIIDLETIP
jgi:hypothetical protein